MFVATGLQMRPVQPKVIISMNLNKYLVKPNSNFSLTQHDPDGKQLFDHPKNEGIEFFEEQKKTLVELQKLLFAEGKHKILVIIQAMDAGGKDGCIKSVFSALDPQGVRVTSFKKPTSEELAHDFLWRVHPNAPANGQIAVWNRSHYEDIIAVKIKNLLPEKRWQNRYRHIIEFERMLADEGTTIIKLFLNISKEEQKSRLEARLTNPNKLWKFMPDDIEDRHKWLDFQLAYHELIQKTSTNFAPWYIIPANRKWYRNLIVQQLLIEKLSSLEMKFPPITFDPASIVIPD